MKDSRTFFKKMVLTTVSLCLACCIFPIGTVIIGGAVAMVSLKLQWFLFLAMAVLLVLSGLLFRKRMASKCEIDCTCKTENSLSKCNKR
jgi:membrane protein implicated in regulation of membrane protease activity